MPTWANCINPASLLETLASSASLRKLRLFSCACCRRVWPLLTDARSQRAVEVAERWADGQATAEEVTAARADAEAAFRALYRQEWVALLGIPYWGRQFQGRFFAAQTATAAVADNHAVESGAYCASKAIEVHASWWQRWIEGVDRRAEWHGQVALLQDIFGNPSHPVNVDLAWHTPTVISLAQAAYDERNLPDGTLDNNRLAILADALEELGCTEGALLAHLRTPGPHVRGCWPVDWLLGKS